MKRPAELGARIGQGEVAFGAVDVTFVGGYVGDPSYTIVTEYRLAGPEVRGFGIPSSAIYVDGRPEDITNLPGAFLPLIDVTSPPVDRAVPIGGMLTFVADSDVGVQLAVGPIEDQRRWLVHYPPGGRTLRLPNTPIERSQLINASRSISGHVRLCDAPTTPDSRFECTRVSDSVEHLLGLGFDAPTEHDSGVLEGRGPSVRGARRAERWSPSSATACRSGSTDPSRGVVLA